MKIIITGSLGHISKPLTKELVQQGHTVTVISSNPERKKDIEALGAKAAIGSIKDVDLLTTTFTRADAVYTMVPPGNYNDPTLDLTKEVHTIVNNYARAIEQSGAERVVHLSSIGAHLAKGNGLLRLHHIAETILDKLPSEINITFMRPTGFYYNLYAFIPMIKQQGIITANYGGEALASWVSPVDIAAAVAEELEIRHPEDRKVRYVASDELTYNETAKILGGAIGKPDLKWEIISDEQMLNGVIEAGMNPEIAAAYVEMYTGGNQRILIEDYLRNRPTFGKVKLANFAKEFAEVYNQN